MAKKKVGFFDRPKTKQILWVLLWGLCSLTILLEIPLHRHSHFSEKGVDGYFSFYAMLSFFGGTVIISVSRPLDGVVLDL